MARAGCDFVIEVPDTLLGFVVIMTSIKSMDQRTPTNFGDGLFWQQHKVVLMLWEIASSGIFWCEPIGRRTMPLEQCTDEVGETTPPCLIHLAIWQSVHLTN